MTNSDKGLLFLLLSSGEFEYQLDQSAQIMSWAHRPPKGVQVLHLRGKLGIEPHINSGVLWVNCEDRFITKKTLLGIKWAIDNLTFDFIIRSNTSTYFDPIKLQLILKRQEGLVFGGDWEIYPKTGQRFVTGTGVFISRTAAELLVSNPSGLKFQSLPDDVAISELVIRNEAIKTISLPRLNLQSHHIVSKYPYVRCKDSVKVTNTAKRMLLYHKYYNSRNIFSRILRYLKLQLWELSVSTWSYARIKVYLIRNFYLFVKKSNELLPSKITRLKNSITRYL